MRSRSRYFWAAALAGLLSCVSLASFAVTAFVATMRAPSGSAEAGGRLYRVDLATGTRVFVGRVLVDGTQPVGLTAMAFHPRTNVLYAVTVGINDANRAALLTVDPATAEARVVGRLSQPLSDISFDPIGQLYGWSMSTGQLARVDIQSGKVATLGPAANGAVGGAFAIDSQGKAFVATWSGPATLERVDLEAGTVSVGPPLANVGDVTTLRSMAFSERGELLAAHSIRGAHAASVLLRIDPETGDAATVANIPDDAEAIAVVPQDPWPQEVKRWFACAMLAATLLVLAVLFFRMGQAARPPVTPGP